MNTFGNIFRLTSFGESHGPAVGGVLDGFPAGVGVDTDFLQAELDRRRPGQSALTTSRREADSLEILSGVFEGKTTGTPIAFLVRNADQHSCDYDELRTLFRPSHADFTYQRKYGLRDHRGGGRSSARETVCRVAGGAFAKLALRETGISIAAYTSQIGGVVLDSDYTHYDLAKTECSLVRCPDPAKSSEMEALIASVQRDGDTVGGVVTCVVRGCPVGLGEPVFGKLHAALGSAMLSINAAKGFEYGDGFSAAYGRGSEQNDPFCVDGSGHVRTATNHSGGIQGGISNGADIYFRVAFKPVATLLREQQTVDTGGRPAVVSARGRHDPCVVPRAVPVVEAMAAMTLLDYVLLARAVRL